MYKTPTHAASMRIYPQQVRETVKVVVQANKGRLRYISGHLEYLFEVYNRYILEEGATPESVTCPACVAKVTSTLKRYVESWELYGIEKLH